MKPVKVVFTEEETKVIHSAVEQVWDEVAYDLLTSIAEEKQKSVETITVSRALVIEVSLDAGRPEENIRTATRGWDAAKSEALLVRWRELSYKDKIAFVKPVFPHTRWGM